MILDCYDSNLTGIESEVTAQWSSFDPTSTSGVVIQHCTGFEMPDIVREFSNLKLLKFYNSTIVRWTDSAAVTETHHPNLIMLFLVRVTLPDGQLPAGMAGDDFPMDWPTLKFATQIYALCRKIWIPSGRSFRAFTLKPASSPKSPFAS